MNKISFQNIFQFFNWLQKIGNFIFHRGKFWPPAWSGLWSGRKRPPSLNLCKNIRRSRPPIVLYEIITGTIALLMKAVLLTLPVVGAITVGHVVVALVIAGSVFATRAAAQRAKSRARDFQSSGHLISTSSQSEPIPIPYGTCRMGGNVVYKHCTGPDNKFYHRIITFGYGPVNGPKQDGVPGGVASTYRARVGGGAHIWTATAHGFEVGDGVVISGIGGTGYNGTFLIAATQDTTHFAYYNPGDEEEQIADTGGTIKGGDRIWLDDKRIQNFGSLAYWEFFYGTSTQTVCGTLQAAHPEFDDAMRDIAYLYLRLEFNSEKFASEPQVTIEGEWRKLYDPRNGQTVFSPNNALVAYDFLRSDLYSIGLPAEVFDIDLIKDAANWCDANGYEFNGPIMNRQTLLDNFEIILQNFRAGLPWSEGLYKLLVYEYDTPIMTLTEDDIEANSFKIVGPGIPETPNRCLVTYMDAANNYVSKTKPVEDPTAVLIYDGEERDFELNLEGTTNALQAEKLGNYYVERNRLNLQFSFVGHPRTLELDPIDMIQITHSLPGWTEKIVRVLDAEERQDGKVNLLVLAELSTLYDDDIDVAVHNPYGTNLPNPLAPPPDVTNLTLNEATEKPGIKITFTRPAMSTNWKKAIIFISTDGTQYNTVATVSTGDPYIYHDVISDQKYWVKVISYSFFDVPSISPPVKTIEMSAVSVVQNVQITDAGFDTDPSGGQWAKVLVSWDDNPASEHVESYEVIYDKCTM